MSDPRHREIWIGAFVLTGLVLVGVMFWVLQRETFQRKYKVAGEFTYAGGIREGTPVHMAGKPIGAVSAVTFRAEADRVMVDVVMEIEEQYDIRSNSKLTVGSVGLIGEKVLEFSLGTAGAQKLPKDGSAKVAGVVPPGLDDLQKTLDATVAEVRVTVSKVNQFLDSLNDATLQADLKRALANVADLGDKAGKLVDNVDKIAGSAGEFVDKAGVAVDNVNRVLAKLEEIAASVQEVAGKLGKLADEANVQITRAGNNVEDLSKSLQENSTRLNETLASINGILKEAAEGQGTLGHLLTDKSTARKLDDLLASLKVTSDSLAETSDFLRRKPNALIFGRDEDDVDVKSPEKGDWRDRR